MTRPSKASAILPGLVLASAMTAAPPPALAQGAACALPEGPVRRSLTLDPACTYRTPLVIDASDVVLDCAGARIDLGDTKANAVTIGVRPGIARVTLRRCAIVAPRGSGLRIGWRYPPAQREAEFSLEERYARAPQDVTIEDVTISDATGVGLYVESYAQRTVLRRVTVEGSGAVGIYIDAGSRNTLVEDGVVRRNGFGTREAPREGLSRREGIAIDSSADNVVRRTRFEGNGSGGILLYRNCNEANDRAENQYRRFQPTTGNLIEENGFAREEIAVWIGSRQSRSTRGQRCDARYYGDDRFTLDDAPRNRVLRNRLDGVRVGIVAEDDGQAIEGNIVAGAREACLVVGTGPRSALLGRPVVDTRVADNRCSLPAGRPGYVSAFGARFQTFTGNEQNARPAQPTDLPCGEEVYPFSALKLQLPCKR